MAKYMLVMRGTEESVAKMMQTPFEQMLQTVGRFNEDRAKRHARTGRVDRGPN
jgi:hypothetical protein